MADDKTLLDLLKHGLKDMYYAENRILKALPKMIEAAESDELREALSSHRDETEGQVASLERAFAALGEKAEAEKCDAMDGILKEGDSLLSDFGGTPSGDAAIIFSCQAVEHYEIARYGSLRAYAELLGLETVAEIMGEILEQEETADDTLSEIAEGSVNETAADGVEVEEVSA